VVIWVNGCFDILHRGHIELFQYANSLGDSLIVGLDTDFRVREKKGKSRPVNRLEDRAYVISALECVDAVVSFESDQELADHIQRLQPDIMVVGSDWRGKKVVGSEHAGEVRFFDRIGAYSTTNILERS
tara:strand:+ start:800 stop:1186 length:387 start_codon:yes stop_codon:yes gene_type:complete